MHKIIHNSKKIFSLAIGLCISQLLNASNSTELFYSALHVNDTATVENYLKKDPSLANTPYQKYISPLFATKKKECIKLLLQHKSNPNIIDPTFKVSPFFCFLVNASKTNDFTIPQLFINYNVDVTAPHRYTAETKAPLFATIWEPQNAYWSSVTQWFAAQCKNPNVQDEQKRSLLHWATHYRCAKEACILLKRNADPNTKNIFDESPFSIAIKTCVLKESQLDEILFFLTCGADPKFRYNNENLIHFLLKYHEGTESKFLAPIIEYLIESGVDPLEPDSDGILPHEKAEKLKLDEVKKLLPSPTKLS